MFFNSRRCRMNQGIPKPAAWGLLLFAGFVAGCTSDAPLGSDVSADTADAAGCPSTPALSCPCKGGDEPCCDHTGSQSLTCSVTGPSSERGIWYGSYDQNPCACNAGEFGCRVAPGETRGGLRLCEPQ